MWTYLGIFIGSVAVALGAASWAGGMHRVPLAMTFFSASCLVFFLSKLSRVHPWPWWQPVLVGLLWGLGIVAFVAGWR